MVAAHRRGVPVVKIAAAHGITRQAVYKILKNWEGTPSVPRDGVRVDAGRVVDQTLAAYEQMIEDLAELVTTTSRSAPHVTLGAISRMLEVHDRRLRLMAAAGYVGRTLAEPQIEQRMVAMAQRVADLLGRSGVPDEVIDELMAVAREHVEAGT